MAALIPGAPINIGKTAATSDGSAPLLDSNQLELIVGAAEYWRLYLFAPASSVIYLTQQSPAHESGIVLPAGVTTFFDYRRADLELLSLLDGNEASTQVLISVAPLVSW